MPNFVLVTNRLRAYQLRARRMRVIARGVCNHVPLHYISADGHSLPFRFALSKQGVDFLERLPQDGALTIQVNPHVLRVALDR